MIYESYTAKSKISLIYSYTTNHHIKQNSAKPDRWSFKQNLDLMAFSAYALQQKTAKARIEKNDQIYLDECGELPKEITARTNREPRFHEAAIAVSLLLLLRRTIDLCWECEVRGLREKRDIYSGFSDGANVYLGPSLANTRALHARTCHSRWRGPIVMQLTLVSSNHIRPAVGYISTVHHEYLNLSFQETLLLIFIFWL